MTFLDWFIFSLYFGVVVGFAIFQSLKNVGLEGYYLANRRLPWGAVGLSVMATQASAITFIGTTGQAYNDGMEFIQVYLSQPLVMVLLCVLFVPFFYRSKVYTAYQYLEQRFDAKTRSLTSFLFLLSRGMAAGIVMYAPAVVLSVILGWDQTWTILIMGVFTILYTATGGITAVIWTDVVQMLMMFVGVLVAVVAIFWNLPPEVGVGEVLYIGGIQNMWRSIDLSLDPTNTYTLWSGLIGGFFLALAYFGCDQSQVQRYLTASSLKQSRLSLIFNAFLKVPMQFVILCIGVLLFVFYHFERPPLIFNTAEVVLVEKSSRQQEFSELSSRHNSLHDLRKESILALLEARQDPEKEVLLQRQVQDYGHQLLSLRERSKELVREVRGAISNDAHYIFPNYLVNYLPAGILGLMIAVIFAAAMSSLDSELAALSSATVIDFYQRYWRRHSSEKHYLIVSKLVTLFWGIFATLIALYAGQLQHSLIELVNIVGSYFYGSILGVFLLAFLVERADGNGAFWGLLAGMVAVFFVSFFTAISWLYYPVVGTLVVIVVGSLLSRTHGDKDPAAQISMG